MKRIVLVLCLAAAIAVPTAAFGGLVFPPDNAYQGRIEGDPSTYFGFDVYTRHGKIRRVNRIATAIPLNCYRGDPGIVDVQVPGSFRVKRPLPILGPVGSLKLFEGDRSVETDAGSGTIELLGVLRRHGRSLGVISLRTHDVDLGTCYSGYLAWRAERGAHVTLPAARP